MSNELLEVAKSLKSSLNASKSGSQIMADVYNTLTAATGADVYIVDSSGKLLTPEKTGNSKQIFKLKQGTDAGYIDARLNGQFNAIDETRENISLTGFYVKNYTKAELTDLKALIVPMYAQGERIGTLIIAGPQIDYDTNRVILAEFCSMLAAITLMQEQKEENAEESRRLGIVRSALSTLSVSELEAILRVFDVLTGSEGVIIASKVAKKIGITCSVIVNALRKLESAGLIESRSMGMKGTYIKVLNEVLIEELNKLRR